MKSKLVAGLTLLTILAVINHAIWQKQQHLETGADVILELAPVDPRSFMQGDYMALEFEVGNKIQRALQSESTEEEYWAVVNGLMAQDGFVIVEKDESGVDRYVDLYDEQPLENQQRKLLFRARDNRIKFATNAFFFAEGQEPTYRHARYGLFKVNDKGDVLLTSLLDEELNLIEANEDI